MGKRRRGKGGPAKVEPRSNSRQYFVTERQGEPFDATVGAPFASVDIERAAAELEESAEMDAAVERAGEILGPEPSDDPVEFVQQWLEAARGLPGWEAFVERLSGYACPVCNGQPDLEWMATSAIAPEEPKDAPELAGGKVKWPDTTSWVTCPECPYLVPPGETCVKCGAALTPKEDDHG